MAAELRVVKQGKQEQTNLPHHEKQFPQDRIEHKRVRIRRNTGKEPRRTVANIVSYGFPRSYHCVHEVLLFILLERINPG